MRISISKKFKTKIEISDDMMNKESTRPLRTYSWFGKEYNPIIIASVNFTMPYANERATFWADEHQIVTNQYDSVLQRQTDSGIVLYQACHGLGRSGPGSGQVWFISLKLVLAYAVQSRSRRIYTKLIAHRLK